MPTWMLLEDEPDLYDLILTMYDMMGLRGVAFSVGEEAREWIVKVDTGTYTGELPELALLDIRLPDNVSGTMIAERIRQSPVLKDIVIVLMTAYRLSPQAEQMLLRDSDADMLLYKPLPRLHDLRLMFHKLLKEKHGAV